MRASLVRVAAAAQVLFVVACSSPSAAPEPNGGSGGGTVISISRDAVSTRGGARVGLIGNGFNSASSAKIGGLGADCTYVSNSRIDCIAPPHAAGLVDIAIVNGNTLAGALEYLPAPAPSPHTSSGYFVYEDFTNFSDINGCGSRSSLGNSTYQGKAETWVIDTPVSDCSGISVDTGFGHSGTRSLKTTNANWLFYGGSAGGGSFAINGAADEPNGLFQHWWFYISQADIDSGIAAWNQTGRGQKLTIARYDNPGFMLTWGQGFEQGPCATGL